ncbi:carboxypeptidase-like regulatory domain-containing protein [candidate division KSB1 bacterium]|nr:carboxypeptidase-like regulatory domain-containing protein [candidate division KSB1 bacterium]
MTLNTTQYMIWKSAWLSLTMFLLITVAAFPGMPVTDYSISGTVRDKTTNEPLMNVNVFLSGTTKGSTTDMEGFYEIKNILPGEYELVVSMMGYQRLVQMIYLHLERSIVKNFTLEQRILPGEAVQVTASIPKDWKKNLKRFKKLFLGESDLASKCVILNPEVLILDYDRETKKLHAKAERPLNIENKALGYKIELVLEDFTYKHDPFFLSYRHNERFSQLMPENEQQARKWDQNRRKVYFGSLRHFLKTLYRGEKALDSAGYETFLLRPEGQPPIVKYRHIKVTADSLLFRNRTALAKTLSFAYPLKVVYLNKKNDRNRYMPTMVLLKKFNESAGAYYDLPDSDMYQTSVISLADDVIINEYGGIYKSKDFYVVAGYWMGDRIAGLLPMDYVPAIQK